ncbi:hypothetical protein H072_5522 [Dactylellina haptotyla CBS 200.50]|uniref:Cns1/TTC4 wheel domain-containing protein n=1 Tax=Dactylellina haptotyla (strain CBS 200.50) TaxID=1284197 RepID=S8BM92_DACHA|nr:hypothetical protein H072_5522 [Dactylellina haptotyla CBS 200.50]
MEEGTKTKDLLGTPAINNTASQYGPEMLPESSGKRARLENEFFRTPLFMQSLDDASGETNEALEALKALAYEGEPSEIAQNFREQGNECYGRKNWKDAVEFYTKALAAGCKVDAINVACYANRAACNLELYNYRRAILDCDEALKIKPDNTKALYRSARAYLALDKIPEAEELVRRGVTLDPSNSALNAIQAKISSRKNILASLQLARQEREQLSKAKEIALKQALIVRGIAERSTTSKNVDLPSDATVLLQDPLDPESTLYFPLLILYPLHLESDFVKSISEDETVHSQLQEILSPFDLPNWDHEKEYAYKNVDVLVEKGKYGIHENPTLSKVGRNIPLKKILQGGKMELIDGILRVFVIPKGRLTEFLDDWRQKNPVD